MHELVEVKEQGRGRGSVPVLEDHVTEYLVGQHPALGVAGGEGTCLGEGLGKGGTRRQGCDKERSCMERGSIP